MYYFCFIFFFIDCNESKEDLIKNNQGIFLFVFLSYIGKILFIIPEKLINRSMEKEKEKEKSDNKDLYKEKGNMVELIFNDLSDRITYKDIINIIIISILLLIFDFLKSYISFNNDYKINRNYIYMKFLFLFLISKYFYKIKYYKHQNISIIIIVIFELIKSIIRIIAGNNAFDLLKDLFISIILSFLEAICITYFKGLMLYKYFSPYKTTFIFGIIDASITLILFIIFSFIPVGDKIGFVKYEDKVYFDNIFFIFENYNIGQFIILIVLIIFLGTNRFLYNMTINYYSVYHLFILFQASDSWDILNEQIDNNNKILLKNLFHLCNLFELFFNLVFLEIIELNFCGLNKNTKKNINIRAKEDIKLLDSEMREAESFIQVNTINNDLDDDETSNN